MMLENGTFLLLWKSSSSLALWLWAWAQLRSLSDDFPLEQNRCWSTLLSLGDKVIAGMLIWNKLQCFTSLQCLWSFAGNKKQLFNRMTVFTECETLKNLKVLWVGLERAGPNACLCVECTSLALIQCHLVVPIYVLQCSNPGAEQGPFSHSGTFLFKDPAVDCPTGQQEMSFNCALHTERKIGPASKLHVSFPYPLSIPISMCRQHIHIHNISIHIHEPCPDFRPQDQVPPNNPIGI